MSLLYAKPLTKEVYEMEGYVIVTQYVWESEDSISPSTGALGDNGGFVRSETLLGVKFSDRW